MRARLIFLYFGFLFLVLFPTVVFGNGFAINEQSTRVIGRGGAFVAQADDPSAVYYNPAGIVQLEGTQATAGLNFVMPKATFKSGVDSSALNTFVGKETDVEDSVFVIPNFYITHKIGDQWGLGFGAFSNFGLGTDWPDNWDGRFLLGGTDANLKTFSLNPVVAYRPIPKLSLSAGAVFQYLDIELKNKRFTGTRLEPEQILEGDNWEVGWNIGVLFRLMDEVQLGAAYRSRVDHAIDGTFEISGILDTGAKADLELPSVLLLGIAWTWHDLTLEFDAHWTEWSTYQKLEVLLDNGTTISNEKAWKDVWAYRFGAEYQLNERFDLRAGLVFDKSPIPDRTLDILVPSGDRWLFTGGLGVHYNKWTIDLAYNFLLDEDRTFDNDAGVSAAGALTGEFKDIYAHIFGINVSYRF